MHFGKGIGKFEYKLLSICTRKSQQRKFLLHFKENIETCVIIQ